MLDEIVDHFSRYERPENFIDKDHCIECSDHFEELRNVPASELRYEHVQNAGWDPTCFLTPKAFKHYFGVMAQIANENKEDWLYIFLGKIHKDFLLEFSGEDIHLCEKLLDYWDSLNDLDELIKEGIIEAKLNVMEFKEAEGYM